MKKILLFLSILLVVGPAFAQVKFKDVPSNSWAASSVYDLVNMGITKGYPDGTFRGNKPITRYETAIFLSKLAKSLGSQESSAAIESLRDQVAELKKEQNNGFTAGGTFEGDWKVGNLIKIGNTTREGVADYRLIAFVKKELGEGADVKVNIDTMDYGWFNDGSPQVPGQMLAELLDIESNLQLNFSDWNFKNPVDLKLTYGPGPKQHAGDPTGAFPSEIGEVFWRPSTGIVATTNLFGAGVSGGYYSKQGTPINTSGMITSGWLVGSIGYTFNKVLFLDALKLDLTGDYISKGMFSTTNRNIKAKLALAVPFGEKVEVSGAVGLARASSNMMVAGALSLNDPWETGTAITIKAARIGSNYVNNNFAGEEYDLSGYDNFNRSLINSTVNFGGVLVQSISEQTRIIGKGDIRLPSNLKYEGSLARITALGGISHTVAPNVNIDANYRMEQNKATGDTTDITAVGLVYKF